MKTIGIIGGLSWQSTIDYYRIINKRENEILGGSKTGTVIVYSVNLDEMLAHVTSGEYDLLGEKLGNAARKLEIAGAELIVLATNTMHVVADKINSFISVPMLHITDALAHEIVRMGFTTVGLIGTSFTMGLPFYRNKLLEEYGIHVITPPEEKYDLIFKVIKEELTHNIIKDESHEKYLEIIDELHQNGAQGIILGCTEIPMLIKQEHTHIPVFDTTEIHARTAAEMACSTKPMQD